MYQGAKSVCWAFGETRPLAPSLQFQTELRKILLSLIEVAQKLLALSPGAVELFTKANGMRKPGGRRDPRADPVSPHLWGQSLRLLPFAPLPSALKLEKSRLLCTWMPSELLVPHPCSYCESWELHLRVSEAQSPQMFGAQPRCSSSKGAPGSTPRSRALPACGPHRLPSLPQRCWTRTRMSEWTRRLCGS